MASSSAKILVLVQLSVLLVMTSSGLADETALSGWPANPPAEAPKHHNGGHHHHHHPPTHPPVKPPMHPPVLPPAHPPVKPPVRPLPVRKLIAVRGVVYCKSCNYLGFNPGEAKPLQDAVVRLTCHNTQYKPVVAEGNTDKNGFFMILPQNVTSAAWRKCKVYLVKSPSKMCDARTNQNYGWTGATLIPNPISEPNPLGPKYAIYNVGPFAFEPSKKTPCSR